MINAITWVGVAAATAAASWASHRYPWWRPPVDFAHARILMYHMINDPAAAGPVPHLAVTPDMFDRQISHLKHAGWRFATVSELIAGPVLRKTVALTFDDGYEDNLTNALPVLQRHDAKATVYLIADRERRLSEGGRANGEPLAPLLSNAQMRQLLASGLVELGAHTLSHRNLATATATERRRELGEAKRMLEEQFERPVTSFAYPFGALDEALPDMVASAGYQSAVTTEPGISRNLDADRFRLKRIRISGRDDFLNFRIRLRIGRRR